MTMPTIRSEARPGRNAPCPCASGRKHKVCCLPRREQAEAEARHPEPRAGRRARTPQEARAVAGAMALLAVALGGIR